MHQNAGSTVSCLESRGLELYLSTKYGVLSVTRPCSKPLKTNPFTAYRDPATGRWITVQPESSLTSGIQSSVARIDRKQIESKQIESKQIDSTSLDDAQIVSPPSITLDLIMLGLTELESGQLPSQQIALAESVNA